MKLLTRLAFCILMVGSLVHAEIPDHILNVARGMGDASTLRVKAKGAAVFSPKVLLTVGGVMFQGEIDTPTFYNLKGVSFNKSNGFGVLTVTLSTGRELVYKAPYWIMKPSIDYAMSEDNGVVSLFGQPTETEYKNISPSMVSMQEDIEKYDALIELHNNCVTLFETGGTSDSCEDYAEKASPDLFSNLEARIEQLGEAANSEITEFRSYYFFAEIHESLQSTGLGFRMLQADSLLIGTSYAEVVSSKGKQANFPMEIGVPRIETAKLDQMMSEKQFKCYIESGQRDIQAWILTDVDTEYSFSIGDSGELTLSGSPYYYLWGPTETEETVGIPECNSAFATLHPEFESKVPRTWQAAVKTAQISALVRGILKANPNMENGLRKSLINSGAVSSFPTPRVWPKQAYQDN